MKNILIAATLAGASIAGILLYLKGNPSVNKKLTRRTDKRVDGHVRHMKYSMG